MKIVHVLTRGDVLGGAQSHVRELSLELRSLGHDVTVITGAPGIFTDQLRQAGIPWLPVKSLVSLLVVVLSLPIYWRIGREELASKPPQIRSLFTAPATPATTEPSP